MTADPGKNVLETYEEDNLGYSYIKVAGNSIKVLESGRGLDPWDRCKIVMPIGNEPDVPGGAGVRPADCPADTTWPQAVVAKAKAKAQKKAKSRKSKKRKPTCRRATKKKAKGSAAKRKAKRCKKRRR